MRKITSITASIVLASLLLVGCATKEETEVGLGDEQSEMINDQTKMMAELKKMAEQQEMQNAKILQEKILIKKEHAKLLAAQAKLLKEKKELEELKKAMALKNKKSIHSFYPAM